jgi:predicted Ser/Thr protein kinase
VSDYLLAGRYRLTDRIAAGGMGEVWRGQDELLNRAVAVKLLPTGRAGDETFLARFRAEARYAASLSHPGIARVYDYGESSEFGGAYLVMELVDGEPLSAILARAGRLSPDATLDIVSQAARALDAAHQAGIVHRDIKPGNLIVAAGGTTKITDFGIATAVRAAQASHLTETGMVMGTAMYVSPEQATGAPVTDSSDIYSLGVVAYECLAGHPPFTAREPLAIAFAHKHEPVPALPPDVPGPVADLVYHMLAKTPEERPANVRVVADRADMLREALALGDGTHSAAYAGDYGGDYGGAFAGGYGGATRADMPAAATGALLGGAAGAAPGGPPGRPGRGHGAPGGGSRRRWLVPAGATAVLCAAAVAVGLYLSGHIAAPTDRPTGNTAQHLNSSSPTPSPSASHRLKPSPHPSVVTVRPTRSFSPVVSPQPVKSATSTPTHKTSPTASASASASTSPTATSSPTVSTSPTATSSPTTP